MRKKSTDIWAAFDSPPNFWITDTAFEELWTDCKLKKEGGPFRGPPSFFNLP